MEDGHSPPECDPQQILCWIAKLKVLGIVKIVNIKNPFGSPIDSRF